jgi:hypothetical protein
MDMGGFSLDARRGRVRRVELLPISLLLESEDFGGIFLHCHTLLSATNSLLTQKREVRVQSRTHFQPHVAWRGFMASAKPRISKIAVTWLS